MDSAVAAGTVVDAGCVCSLVEAAGTESLRASVDEASAVDGPVVTEPTPGAFAEEISGPLVADGAEAVVSAPALASPTRASGAGSVDGTATCSGAAAAGSSVASVGAVAPSVALLAVSVAAASADDDICCSVAGVGSGTSVWPAGIEEPGVGCVDSRADVVVAGASVELSSAAASGCGVESIVKAVGSAGLKGYMTSNGLLSVASYWM